MKNLILFYSYTGSCRAYAQILAQQLPADIEEVETLKRPGTVGAYVAGSFAAIRHKPAKIRPIQADAANYDRVALIAPIWAGNPAPAFNNMLAALPAGKTVDLYFLSGSGGSDKRKISDYVTQQGLLVGEYHDVKSTDVA